MIVSAVPTHGTRSILQRLSPYIRAGSIVVSATKGLEQETLFRVSEIIKQELGAGVQVAVLSGPSFAIEVARELPTAVSVASCDADGRATACSANSARRTSGCTGRTMSSASRSAVR